MSVALQRPTTDDRDAWRAYWQAQGMPWRTEPDILPERQQYLSKRRTIAPDVARSIYPFSIELVRADVEWLLATHESGGMRGPVDWSDKKQRGRDGLDLRGADLCGADLSALPLARLRGGPDLEDWNYGTSQQRMASVAHLEEANLAGTHLEGSHLIGVRLDGASLQKACLQQANLSSAHLERALLREANLAGANLRAPYFDSASNLAGVILQTDEDGPVSVENVRWGDANLTTRNWTNLRILGNEAKARRARTPTGKKKKPKERQDEFERATRANRQLATALRAQGVAEMADWFAYRAQVCERTVLRLQRKLGQWVFSGFLDGLAGYGYKPGMTLLWYIAIVLGFAAFYIALAPVDYIHLSPLGALVLSVSSFHGRGFFPSVLGTTTPLDSPLTVGAAGEAIIGLFIEISFIATFTQRYFGTK